MRTLFLLFILGRLTLGIDESPIATWTCNLCATGNFLATLLLPNGTTCVDLDIAMTAMGKRGCTALALQGATNATEVEQLQASLAFAQYRFNLALGLLIPIASLTTIFSIVTCFWVRRKIKQGQFTIHQSSLPGFPTALLPKPDRDQFQEAKYQFRRNNWS